uniref:Uncharacterized protein n=1 Tax=Pseudictyota dubia TaxID=2749911 RepID=A0A7R9WLB3_9STRA
MLCPPPVDTPPTKLGTLCSMSIKFCSSVHRTHSPPTMRQDFEPLHASLTLGDVFLLRFCGVFFFSSKSCGWPFGNLRLVDGSMSNCSFARSFFDDFWLFLSLEEEAE